MRANPTLTHVIPGLALLACANAAHAAPLVLAYGNLDAMGTADADTVTAPTPVAHKLTANSDAPETSPQAADANKTATDFAQRALAMSDSQPATPSKESGPLLSYASLDNLDEPLAFSVGGATVVVSGVVDLAMHHDFQQGRAFTPNDPNFATNGQVEISERLGNRWTVGAVYFAQYTSGPTLYNSVCSAYCNTYSGGHPFFNDNAYGYVRTSWGTLSGGTVGNLVRNDTRRRPGYGETALGYDDFLGQLARWGGGYQVRFGPVNTSVVVDQDGNFEVGGVFRRPIDEHEVRLSARFRDSEVAIADGLGNLHSNAVGMVGDLTYGSSIYDLGLGYETITGRGLDLQRWYVSSGARTKIGTFGLSAEGHYGQIDGSQEVAASLGVLYAVARGLSANLGVNYSDANVVRNAITILKPNTKSATASVRYSF